MNASLPLVVVAHHRETCGGALPALLKPLGQVSTVHALEGQPLPDLAGVGGVVLLGSHHCVLDESIPGLTEEMRWVERALANNVPMMGICFGAQMMARVAGARIYVGAQPEIGPCQVTPAPGQDWMPQAMEVMQWHHDGIAQVPSGAQRIARGTSAFEEQAFVMGNALGVQFHPETTPAMLRRWTSRCPHSASYEDLAQSLERMHAMQGWLKAVVERLFR